MVPNGVRPDLVHLSVSFSFSGVFRDYLPKNYFRLNLYLGVCFWGYPNKDNYQNKILIKHDKSMRRCELYKYVIRIESNNLMRYFCRHLYLLPAMYFVGPRAERK